MIFTHEGRRYRVRAYGGIDWWSEACQEWLGWGWDVEGYNSYDLLPR